jgi:hypothetical protein
LYGVSKNYSYVIAIIHFASLLKNSHL